MKTDPFTDSALFLIGATGDQQALGAARYLFVVLFLALLAAARRLPVRTGGPTRRSAPPLTFGPGCSGS